MSKLYSAVQIAQMIGITPETVKHWESRQYIPQSARVGLRRKRVWSEGKLRLILEFARDNGYTVPELPKDY